jgi:hypothetical protein
MWCNLCTSLHVIICLAVNDRLNRWSHNRIKFNLPMPLLKDTGKNVFICSHFYSLLFMLHSTIPSSNVGSFYVDKNILNKGAAPHYLQLNALLIWIEVQHPLGQERIQSLLDSCVPSTAHTLTIQMGRQIGTFTDTSTVIPASTEMRYSDTYQARPLHSSHLSSRFLDKHTDKDICDTEQLQNCL